MAMIEGVKRACTALGFFSVAPALNGAEVMNEIFYPVNEKIEVLSSYYGALSKNQPGKFLDAQISPMAQDGDMLVIVVATSGGVHGYIPADFEEVLGAVKHKGDLSLRVFKKIYKEGDSNYVRVFKTARNFFVSCLTIRGAKYSYESKARINSGKGAKGLAVAPRVKTRDYGALITAFVYDDPYKAEVLNQKTLVSLKNGDDGLAVGISPTDGFLSKRVKAIAHREEKGGGDDIAVAVSIF